MYYHEQAHLRCHWLRSLLRDLVNIAILVPLESCRIQMNISTHYSVTICWLDIGRRLFVYRDSQVGFFRTWTILLIIFLDKSRSLLCSVAC